MDKNMDKKKLIGTIIGVIAFAALIAGATYAWLVNNLSVVNGNYSLGTKNFVINYTKGTDISNVPILNNATASDAKSLTVRAGLKSGSAPGTLTIYLNTNSVDSTLLNGVIKYSWCEGTCSGTAFADNTRSLTSSSKVAIVTNQTIDSTTQRIYNIYFWLDGEYVTNEQAGQNSGAGASYSGYISAEAVQTAPDSSS